MLSAKRYAPMNARDKMPFEVTPIFYKLQRYDLANVEPPPTGPQHRYRRRQQAMAILHKTHLTTGSRQRHRREANRNATHVNKRSGGCSGSGPVTACGTKSAVSNNVSPAWPASKQSRTAGLLICWRF